MSWEEGVPATFELSDGRSVGTRVLYVPGDPYDQGAASRLDGRSMGDLETATLYVLSSCSEDLSDSHVTVNGRTWRVVGNADAYPHSPTDWNRKISIERVRMLSLVDLGTVQVVWSPLKTAEEGVSWRTVPANLREATAKQGGEQSAAANLSRTVFEVARADYTGEMRLRYPSGEGGSMHRVVSAAYGVDTVVLTSEEVDRG